MERYAKAPITDAIIDVQVGAATSTSVEMLEEAFASELQRYPKKNPLTQASVVLELTQEQGATVRDSSNERGWVYSSEDGIRILQVRPTGFTFVHRHPYDSWHIFRDEGRRLWRTFQALNVGLTITRLGLRYINRLDLPLPFSDFKEYLQTTPEVAPGLPQALAGFFMQLIIPQPELDAVLVVNEGLIAPALPDHASVVLDFDVFRTNNVPSDEDGLWTLLENFRDAKDVAFEASITEKTRELIR